ncbi:MAG: MFS transporter, partial [Egibacteraceae bacterium]
MSGRPTRGVLAPLRHRDYRLLAVGSLASLLGDGFFRVAIAAQVYAIHNDPRALSAVAVVWMGAQVLLLPVGGWATDRFERRRVMIVADLWRGAAMLTIGLLSVAGHLQLWQLLILGGCFGAGNAFF